MYSVRWVFSYLLHFLRADNLKDIIIPGFRNSVKLCPSEHELVCYQAAKGEAHGVSCGPFA